MTTALESKSAIDQYQDRQQAAQKANAEKLKQEITAAIEESGLDTSPYLVDEVSKRFAYFKDQVQPTSIFKTIDGFLDHYKGKIQKTAAQGNDVELSVQDRIEIQAREKKQRFEEMIYHSRSGNHAAYRKAKAAWSAL